MRALARQLAALVILVILVVGGLAGVAQLKFTSFLSESVRERLAIVAATSAGDFETAIDLGLRIDAVANGDEILARALAHDPDIESIVVFDADAQVLHSAGDPGETAAADNADAYRLASEGITDSEWRFENDHQIGSGIVVEGSFGQPIAGLLVVYPKTEMAEQADFMAGRLIRDGSVIIVALSAAAAVTLVLLRRRAEADLADRTS